MDHDSLLPDPDTTPIDDGRNVFADEFEVDDFDGVADGFRPHLDPEDDEEDEEHNHVEDLGPSRSASIQYAPGTLSRMGPGLQSRNSTRKSTARDNPFANPEDEQNEPTMTFEPAVHARRSISSASSHMFARTGSPRLTSGPSHPYAMYPQGTMARTASVATTATIRTPARQSSDFQPGPQHPYALYPQNVEEDSDDEGDMPQSHGPVGFPGLGRGFRRRVGPDGEEQDIVGADGHAEQLPPYTRWPEDGPEKMPLLGAPAPPTPVRSRAPVAGTDPGMPLMHQSLVPVVSGPPQSMTDESALIRQETRRSTASTTTVPSDSVVSKKSWSEKSWREKRKSRLLGIPLWCYILVAGVLGFIAAVLGGVIGGFVMGSHRHSKTIKPSSALYDASAISSPSGSPPPTGTYALSLSTPQATQASCLTTSGQQVAWSCNLSGAPGPAINVAYNGTTLGASILYASNSTQISYGSQLSWLEAGFIPFDTVSDTDSPEFGPAFHLQTTYDKLVVLPETALSAASAGNEESTNPNGKMAKRQKFYLDTSLFVQKAMVQPGEKPWFCVWNHTFLEAFIFINDRLQSSPLANASTSTSNTSTAVSTVTSSVSTSWYSSEILELSAAATSATSATSAWPSSSSSSFSYPTATHPQYQPWTSTGIYNDDNDQDGPGKWTHHRHWPRQNTQDLYQSLSIYPYIVKIEERRIAGNTDKPYCQQYVMLDNNQYNPATDASGNPIFIYLTESDPSPAAYQSAGRSTKKRAARDGCHCQWVSGQ